jgi:hypothetical protein
MRARGWCIEKSLISLLLSLLRNIGVAVIVVVVLSGYNWIALTGPKTMIAAPPNTHSKRRRISAAAGTSTANGTAQSHRGPNRITVANHQRSPPNRSSSHTANTAATYNHVQTTKAVDGQRRRSVGAA